LDLKISGVKIVFECGIPVISRFFGKPERVGQGAYYIYNGWGLPLDVDINRDNPIFDDFLEDKRRIYWCAGPALAIPEETDHNITALAYYPELEISDNVSTQLHAWRYTGGILGIIKGFLKTILYGRSRSKRLIVPPALCLATDWKKTDKIIQTHLANKPFMTMETYPNENEARVILCGGHPESYVWWGGYIKDMEDTNYNNFLSGFYYWVDRTPWDETVEDELSYNWWIVRRHVAWVSKKVPNNDLPPVYGCSQVSDVRPYNQSSIFALEGNIELLPPNYLSLRKISLDLYYRYSKDNSSNWSDWILYETDIDSSDGWSWEFDTSLANGSGYYQFYSARYVEYDVDEEIVVIIEKAPPGPDTCVYVKDD
jgi:hypothetical protein